jgi:hypothetical protein
LPFCHHEPIPSPQVVSDSGFVHSPASSPPILVLLVFVLVLYVTMVYGPIATFLVESFPARVRYTSVSLPYHVGNGYFGGFLPLIAGVVVASAYSATVSDLSGPLLAPNAGSSPRRTAASPDGHRCGRGSPA